jgi:hypothetical protein
MKNVKKIVRTVRRLDRQESELTLAKMEDAMRDLNYVAVQKPNQTQEAHQAVEDSLVEIFDNVVSLVINELRLPTPNADRRKTLL